MTIKELLTAAHMTQKQASAFLNIPPKTIEGWSSGLRSPSPYMLQLVAEKLSPIIKQNLEARWTVHDSHGDFGIAGFDLIDAIERNFDRIIRDHTDRLGSVAGFNITRMTAEYKPSIIGGNGGCELKIESESIPAVKEEIDPNFIPEMGGLTVWITAEKEDLPEPYEFEIKPNPIRTLEDITDEPLERQFWSGVAIVEALSNYTVKKCESPFMTVSCKYLTTAENYPAKFLELCEKQVYIARLRNLKQLEPLLKTLDEIKNNIVDLKSSVGAYLPVYYQTLKLLRKMGFEPDYE